ncbi:MAG: GH92 family glycosyl hydrolase [Fimbriimonas sp.]
MLSVIALVSASLLGHAPAVAASPVDSADPMVGTAGHGHAFPGATVPFGMVQLSPDTRTDTWDGSSGYHYSDDTILGFSHTHLSGTGIGCYGDIMLMPTVGAPKLERDGYKSRFSHQDEVAKPGYYKVFLQDPKVTAELTSTARAGYHRYKFPKTTDAHVVLDLRHGISNDADETVLKVESPTTISGYRRSNGWGGRRWVYFVAQFSRPMKSHTVKNGVATASANTTETKGMIAAHFDFDTSKDGTVDVKVGISATGVEGARLNLNKEIPGWGFEKVRGAATRQWSDALGKIDIETKDAKLRRTFYTNVYLSYVAPNLFNDADGSYWGMDRKVHKDPGFQNYSTFSLWDTYRTLHPLLTITEPKRVNDMVNSLLTEHKESGLKTTGVWPLWGNESWVMIGYHSVPVIVDAYFKGIRGFDAEYAYQAMKETAMQDRSGLDTYKKLGYVASRPGEQATSKTIEYSVDDWALARMAEALGHKEDAAYFYKRSANYRNHFDGTTRFFRGRRASGEWRRPFDIYGHVGDEYTEADAWQYAFGAQHDVPGMIDLYGGDKGFTQKLDDLFTAPSEIHTNIPDITGLIGQYAQGNEMCHHIAYLYAMAGQPHKTQMRIREIFTKFFKDEPEGHPGNVDCGQMSAWYVMSSAGIYPVNPSNGVYVIGSPAFDSTTFKFGGKRFSIVAENNSAKNIYIQSATLNGKPHEKTWIHHDQMVAGGTLKLVMGPRPSRWGTAPSARPAATMPAGFVYGPVPPPADDRPVTLPLPIRISAGEDEEVPGFTIDPNMTEGMTNGTRVAIDTSAPNAAPARLYMSERYGRDFTYRFPVPKDRAYTVRLHFAEIFDEAVGMRVEDIFLNGKLVLPNFDTLKEAGGKMNKAVVKEFRDVRPNADGTITVRVKAAANSPDQNAKISGIEIF